MGELTATVLAAASAALGVELTGAATLGGSNRSLVLRATAGDRPAVVKAPLEFGDGPVRERAACPLRDLATEISAALRREYGDHPLPLAPGFR